MSNMIKLGQVVSGKERGTAFAVDNIKWVVPIDPPATPPASGVFPLAQVVLNDGTKIPVVNTVDEIVLMANA